MLRRRFVTLVLIACALMLAFGSVANAAAPGRPTLPLGTIGSATPTGPSSPSAAAAGSVPAGPSSPAAASSKAPKSANTKAAPAEWANDRIIVKLNPSVASVLGGLIDRSAGVASEVEPLDVEPRGFRVVTLKRGVSVEQAIAAYSVQPGVSYAQPDFIYHLDATPDDPRFGELWGLKNTGQDGGTPSADIGAVTAWDTEIGDRSASGPIVAVIDTGVDYLHPDLAPNMWANSGENPIPNGVDDDGNGYVDDIHGYDFINDDGDPMDDHGHGTHCSGTIGAVGDNAVGVAGVNWAVRIMALKIFNASGSTSTSVILLATDYANDMRADVCSNSWGGGSFDAALKDLIDASDAVVVFAAGNNYRNDNDASPYYPASYDSAQIVAVAATDRNDELADFSNLGATSVDVAAPGVDILSTAPLARVTSGYQTMSGTSMATPHVAGLAALILARNPALDNDAVKRLILQTAEPLASLSGRCATGSRIDAAAAIAAADAPPTLGLITGSVVNTDTGLPIAGVYVRVRPASSADLWRSYKTAADGTYQASGLPAGTYKVEFFGGRDYKAQYWHASGTWAGATAVTVAAGGTVPGIDARLSVAPPPPNDDFADAQALVGASGSVTGYNTSATIEPDETYGRSHSVWYKWTASTSGTLSVDTAGSDFDTYLTAYSGATLPTLTRLGYNDDYFWTFGPSALGVPVTAGQTYYLAVDGWGAADYGNIVLSWGFRSSHITGKVTAQSGGAVITSATVSVARYYPELSAWYWFANPATFTDASGNYAIDGLPAGDYRVWFSDSGGRYLSEWYNGVSDFDDATTITLANGQTRTDINASLIGASHIKGTVTAESSGLPVADISMYAYRSDGAGGWFYAGSDYSDATGAYDIGGLASGDYLVDFWDSGGTYAYEWYDGVYSFEAAAVTPIPLGVSETRTGIDASLVSVGAITGTVTAQTGGTAVANASVLAYRYDSHTDSWLYISSDISDALGDYSVGGLAPGNYRVRFEDTLGLYVSEYYNGVFSSGLATPVSLGVGETKTGIDASLLDPAHITGRVTARSGGIPISYARVEAFRSDGSGGWPSVGSDHSDPRGDYDIGALPPGDYRVAFYDDYGRYLGEYFGGGTPGMSAVTVLTVAVGETKPNIDAILGGAPCTVAFLTDGTPGSSVSSSTQTVAFGSDAAPVTAMAPGYNFVNWTRSAGFPPTTSSTVTVTDVTADATLTAHFTIKKFKITPSPTVNGSITPDTMQTVNYGASQKFDFTPAQGYRVATLTVDASAVATTATSYTFTNVDADHTIGVTFAVDTATTYTITPTAGAHGSITPSATQTVASGASQTFTFAADAGYHVATVTVDASVITSASASNPTTGTYTFTDVKANHTIGVTFAANPVTTYTITPTAGAHGSISPSTVQTVTAGANATFTFTPDTGYHVATLTVDASAVATTATSYTFTDVKKDHTIGVTFAANSATTYTITPTAGAHGSITPSAAVTVASGASQTFTFTPDSGYRVATLTVDASAVATTATSYTFPNVTADHTIGVTFAADAAVPMPVWRFRNKKLAATYLWTASDAERSNIEATMGDTWVNEGVAFEINTANPLNKDPLWRFLKTTTWTYFFTATEAEKNNTIANLSSMWGYEGPAFSISLTPQTETIWRFRNASTNTFLFTGDVEKALVLANNPEFALEGPAFWIAP